MATLNQTHVHDLSTLANFTDWAQSVGAALASFGWVQSADTGQVQWSTTSITACSASGGNGVYTYTLSAGVALVVGRALNITGMTHSQNNGTFVITALGAGTFTVVNGSAVSESGSSGSTTLTSSVPTSGNTVYEIWQPGDGLTAFNLRLDYWNNSSSPGIKANIGTTTNGSGTLSGTTLTQVAQLTTANSGSTLYNCLYCGDTSSFQMILWRDLPSAGAVFFGVDRSRNSSGSATSSYVSMMISRNSSVSNLATMHSLVFGVGASVQQSITSGNGTFPCIFGGNSTNLTFNGNTGITPVFPFVGYWDNPTLSVIHASQSDFSELATLSLTLLGSTHTYLFCKTNSIFGANQNYATAMRWE